MEEAEVMTRRVLDLLGSLRNDHKLEQLGRYEVHLDRKLERTLTILLRLKDLRQRAVTS
jgi:hypothetical protein